MTTEMKTTTERQLTENERMALARESAADMKGYVGYYGSSNRTAFIEGWEAGLAYATKKASEGVEHLD